jgi:AcrR family transcriptional regulator
VVQTRPEVRPTERARARKRAILEAAGRAFRRHGFHAASMRDIAAELGMQVGNLYYYFESKQALLAYCQDETLDRLLALAARALNSNDSAAARLHWLIVGHVLCIHEMMPGAIAHLTLDPLAPADRHRCVVRRDEYESALRAIVRHGLATGEFRPVDPRVAVWTILGALNGTVLWFRSEGSHSALTLAFEMADQLLRGLLAANLTDTFPGPRPSTARAWQEVLRIDDEAVLAPSRRPS